MSAKKPTRYQTTRVALFAGSVLAFTALAGFLGSRGFTSSNAQAATTTGTTTGSVTQSATSPSFGTSGTTRPQTTTPKSSSPSRQATRQPVTRSRGS